MTAQKAASEAAKSLAEAEAAIAEAEAAAKEAEAAEAEAEFAQVFAKAALRAIKCQPFHIWLDNLILEAIVSLKESSGSDRTAIDSYIKEKYQSQLNLGMLMPTRLKHMVDSGKIIKLQQKYKIAPSISSSEKRRYIPLLLLEGRTKDSPETEKSEGLSTLSRTQDGAEILKAKGMSAQAASEAAKAVAEAAIAEAEAAAKEAEAEAAEADAEAAQVFAKAALRALKSKTFHI